MRPLPYSPAPQSFLAPVRPIDECATPDLAEIQRQAGEAIAVYIGRQKFAQLSAHVADEYIADCASLMETVAAARVDDEAATFVRLADDQEDAGLGLSSILQFCRVQAIRAGQAGRGV